MNKDDKEFEKWFKKICIPDILEINKKLDIYVDNITLDWEVAHEILAFNSFNPLYSIEDIIKNSRDRYVLLT